MRRWPEEMRGLRPDTVYHSLDPATLGWPDADVTDVLDVTEVLDRPEAAIAEHRSRASPFDGHSPNLRRPFPATDHLARVHPRLTPRSDQPGRAPGDDPRRRGPRRTPVPGSTLRTGPWSDGAAGRAEGLQSRSAPMTVQHTRVAAVVPGPRTAEPGTAVRIGWTETWQFRLGCRPSSEYWDVEAARWAPCPSIPDPRRGD